MKMLKDTLHCDYIALYEEGDTKHVVYIELKGSDAKHGCEQLLATVERFSAIHAKHKKHCHLAVHRFVVVSMEINGGHYFQNNLRSIAVY